MESLHPLVRAILFGLLNSPLAALAREAMDRLSNGRPWKDDGEDVENDVSDDGGGGREFQAGALAPDPADPALGLSQLAVLEAVVIGYLRRETEIAARLPVLAERLGLKAVFVEAPSRAARDGGGLLARDRTAAIKDFIDVFRATIERARRTLEGELQGRTT